MNVQPTTLLEEIKHVMSSHDIEHILKKINQTITKQNPNETITSLVVANGFHIQDMLLLTHPRGCHFNDLHGTDRCTVDDFQEVITDFGNCFVFNGWNVPKNRFLQYRPGHGNGLRLFGLYEDNNNCKGM